ncbi:N-acetyltransferase [Serratia rubidaea]|uniref:GNAT family N-acetyltransferase n=1 Tax=Serratia rubidaea TaxID=61652 RepID=UPI0023AF3097|nr:N-acetyltransferase [Serratia rubidaea]MDK1703167.1 N-acetyltransferase [Serratia rubidaea]
MNITISLETPQDIPQVQQVIADAFGSHEEAALVNQLRQDPGWLPALSLVAKDRHGAVIGHVVCTRASVGAHPAVTLAPLSVHPAHQGSGVGSALMLACIEAARAAGEKIITVLGHPHYYPRFGFIPAAGCGVTCRLNNGPDDAKMVMSLDGAPIPPGEMGFCRPMTEAIQAYQPAADNPSATN